MTLSSDNIVGTVVTNFFSTRDESHRVLFVSRANDESNLMRTFCRAESPVLTDALPCASIPESVGGNFHKRSLQLRHGHGTLKSARLSWQLGFTQGERLPIHGPFFCAVPTHRTDRVTDIGLCSLPFAAPFRAVGVGSQQPKRSWHIVCVNVTSGQFLAWLVVFSASGGR